LCIFEATIFHSVAYHPDFAQILTVGSDKRITYYDVFTGETLRVIQSGEDLACAAVNGSGSHFAVAGSEGTVKMFDYETGQLVSLGKGHSTGVAALAIAPNQTFLVSGGEDGGLFFWNFFEQHN
jgi:WD40 repeat protein